MTFAVTADAYDRFMGRFSQPLADRFVDVLRLAPDQRVLDVGAGPGALTERLLSRVAEVAALDPSPTFVDALRERFPALDVRAGRAEELPFDDATFDRTLAQLVVHFLADPVAGVREMARVTRPGGLVAASVWDHAGGAGPLSVFWDAVRSLDAAAPDESALPGVREGELAGFLTRAGLRHVEASVLRVRVPFASYDDWWTPYTLGVGPAGDHVAGLDDTGRDRLRAACEERLPAPPFEVEAAAWCTVGLVPGGEDAVDDLAG